MSEKLINMIKAHYVGFECNILHNKSDLVFTKNLKIWWSRIISNQDLLEKTNDLPIELTITYTILLEPTRVKKSGTSENFVVTYGRCQLKRLSY